MHVCWLLLYVIPALSVVFPNGDFAATAMVRIYIVPHSHCDPGWRLPPDDEFSKGQGGLDYYTVSVRSILHDMVLALWRDPERRFVWSEIHYFRRFYEEVKSLPFLGNESLRWRTAVTRLVDEGRLEFVGGGVVQNDEALPTVDGILTQLRAGHEYLLREFGVRPRVAWQIDSFGHSSITPTLFREVGFDSIVLNRIPYKVRLAWAAGRGREFIWHGDPYSAYSDVGIFAHVLPDHYNTPHLFRWDNGADPIRTENVEFVATQLVEDALERRQGVRHRNVLYLWGDDFAMHQEDVMWGNMRKLMDYINANAGALQATIQLATFSEYLEAVASSFPRSDIDIADKEPATTSSANLSAPTSTFLAAVAPSLPSYTGDFFPYEECFLNFWTGFYSTRPWVKQLVRQAQGSLRAARLLAAAAPLLKVSGSSLAATLRSDLDDAARQVGLAHHHDTITGTSRKVALDDTRTRLLYSLAITTNSSLSLLGAMLGANVSMPIHSTDAPFHLPQHIYSHASSFRTITVPSGLLRLYVPVVVFNDLTFSRSGEAVELLLESTPSQQDPCHFDVTVSDHRGGPVTTQLRCTTTALLCGDLHEELPTTACASPNRTLLHLQFPVTLEGLAWAVFFVTVTSPGLDTAPAPQSLVTPDGDEDIVLANSCLEVTFTPSGQLQHITHRATRRSLSLSDEYTEYYSDPWPGHGSGAYVMRTSLYPWMLLGLGVGAAVGVTIGAVLRHAFRHQLQLTWKRAAIWLLRADGRARRRFYALIDAHHEATWRPPARHVAAWLLSGAAFGAVIVSAFLAGLSHRTRHVVNVNGLLVTIPTASILFGCASVFGGPIRTMALLFGFSVAGFVVYVGCPSLQVQPPDPAEHFPEAMTASNPVRVVRGDVTAEVHKAVSPHITHKYVLPHGRACHIDLAVRATSLLDRPLAMRFATRDPDLAAVRHLYTDNGHGLVARDFSARRLAGGNHFPAPTAVHWIGGTQRVAFLTQQAVGVGFLPPGVVEFMLHRQLSADDEKGMNEPLIDPIPATFMMRIAPFVDASGDAAPSPPFHPQDPQTQRLSQSLNHPLTVAHWDPVFWPPGAEHRSPAAHFAAQYSTVVLANRLPLFLPPHIHLLAFVPYKPGPHSPLTRDPFPTHLVALTLQNIALPGTLTPDQVTVAWRRVFPDPPARATEVSHTFLYTIADVSTAFTLPAQAIKTFVLAFRTS